MKTAAAKTFRFRAFTLIEIMIVVAIIGLMAAMGAPVLLAMLQKDGMRKAVGDVTDLLGDARAQAILKGQNTDVSFRPADNRLDSSIGKSVTLARRHRDGRHRHQPDGFFPDGSFPRPLFPERHLRRADARAAFRRGLGKDHPGIFHCPGQGGTADQMKTRAKKPAGRRAFSLLEVMIAIGIFFMCIFVILSLVSMSLRNARRLERPMVDAAMIASELSLTNQIVGEFTVRRFRRPVSGLHLDGGHQ